MKSFRRLVRRLHCQTVEHVLGNEIFFPHAVGEAPLLQIFADSFVTDGGVLFAVFALDLNKPESASNIFGVEPNRLIPVDVTAHAFNLV